MRIIFSACVCRYFFISDLWCGSGWRLERAGVLEETQALQELASARRQDGPHPPLNTAGVHHLVFANGLRAFGSPRKGTRTQANSLILRNADPSGLWVKDFTRRRFKGRSVVTYGPGNLPATPQGDLDPQNLLLPTLKRPPCFFKSNDHFYAAPWIKCTKKDIFTQLRVNKVTSQENKRSHSPNAPSW